MTEDRFKNAVQAVLDNEGGFVNDPADPGGATNHGISLRFLRSIGHLDADGDGRPDGDVNFDGDIDHNDILILTTDQAIGLYRAHFWDRYDYASLPPMVGEKVFDLAVNAGPVQAHKLLQRALRACGQNVVDDGIIGPKTKQSIKRLDVLDFEILVALRSEAAGFYRGLVIRRPEFSKYLRGWLSRAYS